MVNLVEKKIKSFLELSDGWHFSDGETPSIDVIEQAIKLHNTLVEVGLSQTDAFPGIDGEVRVTAYTRNSYYEFTIDKYFHVTFVYEINNRVQVFEEDLSINDAILRIRYWGLRWASFESSTKDIMTVGESGSKALHLDQEARMYQSSTEIASPITARAYATTSKDTIREKEVPPLFIGILSQDYSQNTVNITMKEARPEIYATSTSGD